MLEQAAKGQAAFLLPGLEWPPFVMARAAELIPGALEATTPGPEAQLEAICCWGGIGPNVSNSFTEKIWGCPGIPW